MNDKAKVTKKTLEEEEARIQQLVDEREEYRKGLEVMCETEKKELQEFKAEKEFQKAQDTLREAGKLIMMSTFMFHFQEEAGGTLPFTLQQIRFSLKDGATYTYPKYVADHVNGLSYPDRELTREGGEKTASLKVVGRIPRCTATVLRTFEKEFDAKTDLPDQDEWKNKATAMN
jgi:hypothetical protein